jgi:hypothetical protein
MSFKHGKEQETAVMLGEEMMPVLTCRSFVGKDE